MVIGKRCDYVKDQDLFSICDKSTCLQQCPISIDPNVPVNRSFRHISTCSCCGGQRNVCGEAGEDRQVHFLLREYLTQVARIQFLKLLRNVCSANLFSL